MKGLVNFALNYLNEKKERKKDFVLAVIYRSISKGNWSSKWGLWDQMKGIGAFFQKKKKQKNLLEL